MAPYLHYLNLCEGLNITTFKQLEFRIIPDVVRTLEATYKDARDIDLIVGALVRRGSGFGLEERGSEGI